MVWYKSWLETQFRLLFTLGVVGFWLIVFFLMRNIAPPPGAKPAAMFALVATTQMVVMFTWPAGAGIATQPAFQEMKGLFGSTQYTLSLPVSRLRLLAVRAGIGWLEMTVSIAVFCGGMWLVAPVKTGSVTAKEMSEYVLVLVVCSSSPYCMSVLFATLLDEMWRMKAGTIAFTALWALSSLAPLPASVDIIRAMGDGSPLVAHTIPWTAMAFSLALSAVLFFASLKIVQGREY
jgi:ABC-2 type transport system permease protein